MLKDSVPGEEKFYNWSNKTKDFASNNLSNEIQEKFYANVAKSSNSHSDQSTLVAVIDNEQQRTSDNIFQNFGNETSPKNKKKSKGKGTENARLVAERDRILKKYSHRLMRRKPRSWQP